MTPAGGIDFSFRFESIDNYIFHGAVFLLSNSSLFSFLYQIKQT